MLTADILLQGTQFTIEDILFKLALGYNIKQISIEYCIDVKILEESLNSLAKYTAKL